jgi:release factor glutamine methyltransferase
MDIATALARARAFLHQKGIEAAPLEAEVLLAHVTGTDRVGLYREANRPLSLEEEEKFQELLQRRAAGEPVAYLTGCREFMGLTFRVTRDVLIPRPETELLVEAALELLTGGTVPGEERLFLADVGTGSGAIAVSLARYLGKSTIYATDISPAALAVAAENARRQGVAGRIIFLAGDLLSPLQKVLPPGSLSLVAANLPYIPSAAVGQLMPDVARYEPHLALDGGCDGLELYRRLVPQARELLAPGGYLLMEIDPSQAPLMARLLPEGIWRYRVRRDLAGRERLVVAQLMVSSPPGKPFRRDVLKSRPCGEYTGEKN